MAKTRNAASQLSTEWPERNDVSVGPITGMFDRKLRSTAGTALLWRLIEVPLSPPVAMASANTVPPAARILMAKPTRMMSAFMRSAKNAIKSPSKAPAPRPATTATYQGA